MHSRLYDFLSKYNILYPHQFGFRKNHSTTHALLDVIDECYKNLDIKNHVVGIFIDLEKAFDCIHHDILLRKLYYYGIRGNVYLWLKSFFN